jgi:predicted nucleic acid-binding protein
MPSGCFIDTNLLLYRQDPSAPEKAQKVGEWLIVLADRNDIVISAQVVREYAHNIIRKFRHIDPARLAAELEIMRPWCRAPESYPIAIGGLVIHRRFRFSFYDSGLVASALEYGCDLFLSEDMSHQQRVGNMRIINPFASEPRDHL